VQPAASMLCSHGVAAGPSLEPHPLNIFR
jgi:hypothetical protein